jgi:hypothetical protein
MRLPSAARKSHRILGQAKRAWMVLAHARRVLVRFQRGTGDGGQEHGREAQF